MIFKEWKKKTKKTGKTKNKQSEKVCLQNFTFIELRDQKFERCQNWHPVTKCFLFFEGKVLQDFIVIGYCVKLIQQNPKLNSRITKHVLHRSGVTLAPAA